MAEAAEVGHRHLPDLRRPERRRADAAGHRGGPGDRQHHRRGGALLHRRPESTRTRTSTPSTTTCKLAEKIVDAGAHILAIKDMAGLLRPPAAKKLVTALRERFDLPVHLHTHDTAGGQLATLLAAVDAGVDAVDVASAPMAGTTSQVARLGPGRGAGEHRAGDQPRPAGGDGPGAVLGGGAQGLRAVRVGPAGPTGRVYDHEIPGGQLSNLRQQAIALGLGEKFEAIEAMYTAANTILGRPTKVTPVVEGRRRSGAAAGGGRGGPEGLRREPAELRHPRLGDRLPRRRAGRSARRLARAVPDQGAAGPDGPEVRDVELSDEDSAELDEQGPVRQATLNRLLFPGPTKEFLHSRETYGNVSRLDTLDYLYGLRTGDEHVGPDRQGGQPDPRAVGDRQRRRARHADRDVHDQRPAAADPGPRQLDQGRHQGRRAGRPEQARVTSRPRSPGW